MHKNILAIRSNVFEAMFEHDCQENQKNRIEIEDLDGKTCGELLRYIYTGKVPKMEEYALELFAAADKVLFKKFHFTRII